MTSSQITPHPLDFKQEHEAKAHQERQQRDHEDHERHAENPRFDSVDDLEHRWHHEPGEHEDKVGGEHPSDGGLIATLQPIFHDTSPPVLAILGPRFSLSSRFPPTPHVQSYYLSG